MYKDGIPQNINHHHRVAQLPKVVRLTWFYSRVARLPPEQQFEHTGLRHVAPKRWAEISKKLDTYLIRLKQGNLTHAEHEKMKQYLASESLIRSIRIPKQISAR